METGRSERAFLCVARPLCGFGVDGGDRDFAQGLVRLLFFREGLIEQLDSVTHAEAVCPRPKGTTARYFVVLYGLRGREQAGVKRARWGHAPHREPAGRP